MPRKSSTALAVVPGSPRPEVKRPKAPKHLTKAERAEWKRLVEDGRLPADYFPPECLGMVAAYVQGLARSQQVSALIRQCLEDGAQEGASLDVAGFDRLVRMESNVAARLAMLSTKLGLALSQQQVRDRKKPAMSAIAPPWADDG